MNLAVAFQNDSTLICCEDYLSVNA